MGINPHAPHAAPAVSAAPVPGRVSRRAALLALPAALTLSGCSRIAELPGLQRVPMVRNTRTALANSLYWIRGVEGVQRTDVVWSRPRAMAQVVNAQDAADLFAPGLPAHWLSALAEGDPQILATHGPFGPAGAKKLAPLARLAAPSAAIAVRELHEGEPLLETVSWHDAAELLPRLVEPLGDLYEELDDGSLALRADVTLPHADEEVPRLSALIRESGGRLVFDPADEDAQKRAEEDADGGDVEVDHVLTEDPRTGERLHLGSAAPLVGMLTALGMDDAHLVRGSVLHGRGSQADDSNGAGDAGGSGEDGGARGIAAWLWATRLRSPHQHITRGILRPAEGTQEAAHALTQRVLGAKRSSSGITMQRVRVEGTDVVVETGHDSSSEDTGWSDLPTFYAEMEKNPASGISLSSEE